MNLIVCLDDRDGMSIFGRRQSTDRILREQILEMTKGELWMNRYSAGQFSDNADRIIVDEDFLDHAPEDAWCFAEVSDIRPYLQKIHRLVIYRWNRHYPSDRKFPTEALADRWILESSREFPGSSHERITEEVYSI